MRRFILILVMVAACIAQTATPPASPKLYTYYLMPGAPAYLWNSVVVDPPLALTTEASGQAHLGLGPQTGISIQSGGLAIGTANTIDIEAGYGVSCIPQVNAGVMTLQCNADHATVAYRVDPPAGPGPCVDPVTNLPYGAGAYASDGAHHYECIQGAIGWIWAASTETTAW